MTVLQELDRYYDRMAARHDVVLPGWSMEPIGVVLEVASDGALLGTALWLDDRKKPRVSRVPKWFSRSGTSSTPNFLWDNAAYVLGLGTKDPAKTARDHAAFRALHLEALEGEADPGLLAVRRFLEHWVPYAPRVPGLDDKALALNFGFRLQGEYSDLVHERPAVLPHVERLRKAGAPGETGFCLVRGARLPLVRLHPKIKGVDGTASAEVPLVSFNADAFTSYGKDQGYNAPTSAEAAFRYGAALNALLTRGGPNRLRIADLSVAFWADASALDAAAAGAAAACAENIFAVLATDQPAPTDDRQQAELLRDRLRHVTAGQPLSALAPELRDGIRFHVLALAPNAARLSVRTWISNDFSVFIHALAAHGKALALDPIPRGGQWPPSVHRLLTRTTALQEKAENIPAGLTGAVLQAVLAGSPYPRTWLTAVLTRLRAGDDRGSGWHAAAIKAGLSRMNHEEPAPMSLDEASVNPAYQLGRLFAVLEKAQREALGRVNASVADRYYGSFSATPARVFATLMRGARIHISAANKLKRGFWIDKRIEQIMTHLPEELPRTLRVEDQGRFAIGYYHERAYFPPKPPETSPDEETP